jgi:hypothetical protein
MTTIDILSQRKIANVYRTELRFAINKDFFFAFNEYNPPFQRIANGFRLHLRNGERVDVPESFEVEVSETI